MAKFELTITGTYQADDSRIESAYGTTDLDECAAIDSQSNALDLLALCDNVQMVVRPVREPAERIAAAIALAEEYGYIDGAHHKDWVIEQMVAVLGGEIDLEGIAP